MNLQVRPIDAANGATDRHLADAVLCCERLLGDSPVSVSGADLQDLRGAKPRLFVRFPARQSFGMRSCSVAISVRPILWPESHRMPVATKAGGIMAHPVGIASLESSTLNRVLDILGLRTRPQVRWANTKGRVTRVQDEQALWDRPYFQFVGEPMGIHFRTTPVYFAVTGTTLCPAPQPAFATLVNAIPESPYTRRVVPHSGASA